MKEKKTRDRVTRPRNPADIRLNELRRMEAEEQRWAGLAGPVIIRSIPPKEQKER